MKIEDFAGKSPVFRPETFFDGRLEGWGVMEGATGAVQKRFTVAAEGHAAAEGGRIRYRETWTFDDGHVDTLDWEIWREADGGYAGSEARSTGEAEGEQAGCAFHWRYSRDTPQPDGKSIRLNFDDWFFRIDNDGYVAKGTAGRLGLPFATAYVTYRKLPASDGLA
ncbi:MAG: DUF3833 family protein [Phenylobacterium sp.]|uniref:DUF3833 family protein n=1 Tax=Phenylobacterium sp. TaxID=1871053 RepID=UPI001A461406|nr:DUF3833 family protein [Phenylobacterium sp.]MBL8773942.1 DUF3833 family protein [Phenylobacterium sp.]